MSNAVIVDVREDIRSGREPFSKIMSAVAQLQPDEKLLLLAPFEPKPLFGVLGKQGFSHTARQLDGSDWEVVFTRETTPVSKQENIRSASIQAQPKEIQFIDLDVRGLEPPMPMVTILETLETLPAGTGLRAQTDRRPMHLYAQLEARGFNGQSEEQNDGSFITIIRRN